MYGYPSGLYDFTSVQLILNHSVTRYKADGSVTNKTISGLDNIYPYQILGDGDGSSAIDNPGFNLFTNDIRVVTTQSFRMILLFRPDEPSIPVPIKQIDWQWTGTATTNSTSWVLVQPGSIGTITANNQNTMSHPTWTNVVVNQR
jgi:hypothetical protein